MIDLDFYLSEMSVSDLHGGGLTLQRVLGADLAGIRRFIHVARLATDYPVRGELDTRCVNLPIWAESSAVRGIVGNTRAAWLARRPAVLRGHARRVAAAVRALHCDSKKVLRGLVCPQTPAALYAMEAIAEKRQVSYLTWVMDDHFVRWVGGDWQYDSRIESLLARHLQRARAVFVISPALGEFYRRRFGVESSVLFSPADPCGEPQWERPRDTDCVRLAYFGSVGPWQLDALLLLAECLEPAGATLDLYTGDSNLEQLRAYSGVNPRGRLSPSAVAGAMRGYDAVVLPVGFEPALRNMSEFNIATKMSECLASGTVTLLVGPDYSAMARFLSGSGSALLATERTSRAVAETIAQLRDRDRRIALLQSARALVETRLGTDAMRRVWEEAAAQLR